MTSFRLRIMAQVLPFLLIAPGIALAQAPPTRGEAAAALNAPANPALPQYSPQQIDQLVAPVALYPDQLLTQVLMAATYPQQIMDAAQWLRDPAHANLKGDALVTALEPLPWEPSVKALVAFPQVIIMLSEHIEWTQALGVAFATQQPEVMVRVQSLRHLAYHSGKLRTFRHLAVREEGTAIVIASAEPDRIFVPVYNPVVIYGAWPDRDYPPVYIPPPPDFVAERIAPGIEVSVGYGIVAPLWGWSRPDWRDRRITINRAEYSRITRNVELAPGNVWQHRGAVVLAAPATERRNERQTAQAPHGTVAPAAAAAVVSLPQRAAAQPTRIRAPSAAERTGVTQPNEANRTTTGEPAQSRPGEANRTATGQPAPTQPNEANRTATGQPAPTQSNEANRTATGRSAPTQSNEANRTATGRSEPANPATNQPAQRNATAPTAGTGSTTRQDTAEPGAATHRETATQPTVGEHKGAASERHQTHPATTNRTQPGEGSTTGSASRHETATQPSGGEPRSERNAHGRAHETTTSRPPAAEPAAPGTATRHESAAQPGGRAVEAQPMERRGGHGQEGAAAPARQQPNAPAAAARTPEHAAGEPHAAPHAPAGAAAAQHTAPPSPAPHETAGQGSSAPAKQAPHATGGGAGHEQPGGHAGRSEDSNKNEH